MDDPPRAVAARFDSVTGRVIVDLDNGCAFACPARNLQGLEEATDAEIADIEILGRGYGLHWEALDIDHSVPGMLVGVFGTKQWMAREMARRAGATKSPAKAAAARDNGKKGGRPRKPSAA